MGNRFADEERAALLALLDERPAMRGEPAGNTSWPTIASEVSLRGSALAIWHDLHPSSPQPGTKGQAPSCRCQLH